MKSEMYKQLLKDNRFSTLLEYLEEDFKELYKHLLEYKEVKIEEKWNLTRLGCEVAKFYPDYSTATTLIDNAFFSGEYSHEEALDTVLRLYGSMKKNYKKH